MTFLYVEGVEMPVSEARAIEMVSLRQWYECAASHRLKGDYEGCIRVFHKDVISKWAGIEPQKGRVRG